MKAVVVLIHALRHLLRGIGAQLPLAETAEARAAVRERLLNWLSAISAARKVCLDLPCGVDAEATMTRLSNGLGNRGRLIRGVHVLVVDHDLVAIDDAERVARFLARG